jgi:hypothetical protein
MPLKKGASKAMRSMRSTYGKKRGTAVFYATYNKNKKRGQSYNAFYKRGAKRTRKR